MDVKRKFFWGVNVVLIVLFVLIGQALSAMGLGNINVNSSLNEPLSASIPIFKDSSETNISTTDLTVSIANTDLHRNAGLPYPNILDDLRFNIVTDQNGRLVLNVYSVRSVYEPLLNFLVDVRWNGGQLVKEYSLILDPVTYTASAAAQNNRPITPNTITTPRANTQNRSRASNRTIRPVVLSGDSYQVQSGDSLSKIAMAVRAEQGGNLDDIMQTIYATNPDAFLSSPDQLLANVQIVIPDYYAGISEQTTSTPLATETAITTTPIAETVTTQTSTTLPITNETTTAAISRPRLEILPPDEIIKDADAIAGQNNTAGSEQTALTEQAMKMLEEEQQRNTRLETRNASLEQKIDDMLESNQQMQIRLNQLIEQQQQPASAMPNFWRFIAWPLLALALLFMSILFYKRRQDNNLLPATPAYQAEPTSTQRMVPDLDAYTALDSNAEAPYESHEGLLSDDDLIDDLATSQELYEPTNIIDADVEATQTFMGSLDDVELDAGQNLDAAQEAEIYLAYQQFKLADKTISRLIESEPDNYKFQILKLQLLSKTGKMEELQELSVELLSRFPNRDDEVHQRIQEICDMAFSANMGGKVAGAGAAASALKEDAVKNKTESASESESDAVPEYEQTKEIEAPTEPGLEMTALQDDITEFLNEDLTLSDTDPMLISSIIDHEVETEINPDVEYTDISDQLTELMDDITEEGLDLPFDLETEILQEEQKRKILDQHNDSDNDDDEEDQL